MSSNGSPTATTAVPMPTTDGAIPTTKKDSAAPQLRTSAVPVSLLKKLFALAIFFALVFLYIFFANGAHDPLWWQHAGISHETKAPGQIHPKVLEHALNKLADPDTDTEHLKSIRKTHEDGLRSRFGKLENGSAYEADYDVSSVVPRVDPPLGKGTSSYSFHYMNRTASKYKFNWLSARPMVAHVPNFLTDEECDRIIAESSKTMQRSQVVPYKDSKVKDTQSEVRTSSQTWLGTTHPVVADVVNRIFDITGFPPGSSEMMQVLRYDKGQKYDAHLDYFDPKLYGAQTTNRAVTVFIYLATVEEGGWTQFPRADGKPPTWDFKSCIHGLKVRPVKGTIAIFYDMQPNGEYDDTSLHGGCRPVVGTKWGGTLWLRVPVK